MLNHIEQIKCAIISCLTRYPSAPVSTIRSYVRESCECFTEDIHAVLIDAINDGDVEAVDMHFRLRRAPGCF